MGRNFLEHGGVKGLTVALRQLLIVRTLVDERVAGQPWKNLRQRLRGVRRALWENSTCPNLRLKALTKGCRDLCYARDEVRYLVLENAEDRRRGLRIDEEIGRASCRERVCQYV